jgi:CRP-like cAMP-binding protein
MRTTLEVQVSLLSTVDILSPLSQAELEHLARNTVYTFLERGDIFCIPRKGPERLFILMKGRVHVYEVGQAGRETTLALIEGGDPFGVRALNNHSNQEVYASALLSSHVCSIRCKDLRQLIMNKPEVGLRLIRHLTQRLNAMEIRYAGIINKEVHERLATLIMTLVDSEGVSSSESWSIPTHYTHEQLASMIGCTRGASCDPGLPKSLRRLGGRAKEAPHLHQGPRRPQRDGRALSKASPS